MMLKFKEYCRIGYGEEDPEQKEPEGQEPEGKEKLLSQEEVNRIVAQRTERERKKNKQLLTQLEQIQQQSNLSEEQKEELEKEVEELRKRTLSAEEIRKREAQKAEKQYQEQLQQAKTQAETWKKQHDDLKINLEINNAAAKYEALPQSVPFISSFLKSTNARLNEEGRAEVDFEDIGEDGKPVKVTMTVDEVVGRMKEMPDKYGHLFTAMRSGGTGQFSGEGGKTLNPAELTPEEYARIRKENPEKIYG